jgi:hypothetical protein
MATHPLHMMDGDSFERIVHLDYCEVCHDQIPTVVFWLMYRPGAIVGDPIKGRADPIAIRESLKIARDAARRHYKLCGVCGWISHMRKRGYPWPRLREIEGRERAKMRAKRLKDSAEMRAQLAAEPPEDVYDRGAYTSFLGCGLRDAGFDFEPDSPHRAVANAWPAVGDDALWVHPGRKQ